VGTVVAAVVASGVRGERGAGTMVAVVKVVVEAGTTGVGYKQRYHPRRTDLHG
jgi:hypothetical protein